MVVVVSVHHDSVSGGGQQVDLHPVQATHLPDAGESPEPAGVDHPGCGGQECGQPHHAVAAARVLCLRRSVHLVNGHYHFVRRRITQTMLIINTV